MAALTSADEIRVDAAFKALRLPGAARAWRSLLREAETGRQEPAALLAAILETELQSRRDNVLQSRLREAHFPEIKSLDTFDFAAQPSVNRNLILTLAKGLFIRERFGVCHVGNPGTGKSHLGIALGVAGIQAGFRVRFITAPALASELLAAIDRHQLPRLLKTWRRFDLVVLDDLGYIPLSRDGAQALFQFFADRYEHGRSILVTTNLDFASWTEVVGDPQMTSALLDRFTHRLHVIEHTGESFRFRESLRRRQEAAG